MSKQVKQSDSGYILGAYYSLQIEELERVQELSHAHQQKFFALSGSIRQLMEIHNALCDTATEISGSNRRAVNQCLSLLAARVHSKISAMNDFLSVELDNVEARSKRTRGKKKAKKHAKKKAAKNAKKKSGRKPRVSPRKKVKAKS